MKNSNTNKCPCVNCITFAICKSQMQDKFAFSWLRIKCSIFCDHYNYRYMNPDSDERIFLLKLFKPLYWEKRIDYPEGVVI